MNSLIPDQDRLSTVKHLISTFSRQCEGEFSRIAQTSPSNSEKCDVPEVVEVIEIFSSPLSVSVLTQHPKIDWFISQTNELASSLRTFRNSLVPINRIPPEIITSIIAYRVAPAPDLGQYQVLSTLAAVCRYWRNAICSFPSLWTNISDVYSPQLRKVILERSKAAPLHVSCLRPTDGFKEDIGAHTSRIKTLQCKVVFSGGLDEPFNDAGTPNKLILDFESPSDALKTLCLYRNVAKSMPETVRFGIIPDNAKALKTLELRNGVPLTIQFTQLTTITNFFYSHPNMRLGPVLDFLAANTLLEEVTIRCPGAHPSDPQNHLGIFPLDHLRQLSLSMGPMIRNILQHLRLPSTSRVDLFVNALAESTLLGELLPVSLHDLPGIAKTTLLHCKFTSEFHLIVIGSNSEGGMITVRGHPTQLFAGKPVNLRPLNLAMVREFILSSIIKSLASTWTRFLPTIQEMSGVETLVVGNRVTLRDLPTILRDKDLFPNLSAITLVTPPLNEIPSFVASVLARAQTPGARGIEYLEILCLSFDRDHLAGAVGRPLEGYVGLVEVRAIQDVDEVWVRSIKRTMDRDGFLK